MSVAPVINQAAEPASVRSGGPATQKAYTSALDFESMLVQQLSQSLTESSESVEPESENEGEAANPELSSMLPQALTEGVMHDGGLGLAQQLMPALDPSLSNKLSSTGGIAA
jgi:Rod binding domain-containing protein